MCNQYLDASIYFNVKRVSGAELLGFEGWGHFRTLELYAAARGREGFFRFGSADGPQYYPILTWVYAVAVVAITGYFLHVMTQIFGGRPGGKLQS